MIIFVAYILAASGARIILLNVLGIDSVFIHLVVGTLAGLLLPLLLWVICRKLKIARFII